MTYISEFRIVRRIQAIVRLARRAYRPYIPQILALTALGFFGGILEGIGINTIIPLLSFIIEADGANDIVSTYLRSFFDFFNIDFAPKYLLTFIVILFFVRGATMFVLTYLQIRIAADYEKQTRTRLLESMFRSSWAHLLRQHLGHLETILMVDVPASGNLLRKLAITMTVLSSLLIYLIVAFNISFLITVVTIVLAGLIFLVSKPILYRIRSVGIERVAVNKGATHHVGEYMLGVKAVKAAGVEESVIATGHSYFARLRDLLLRTLLLQQVTQILIPPLGVLFIAIIFALAFRTDFISMAALPAIVYLIYRIFLYVQQIQDNMQGVNDLLPHLQSVLQYEDSARVAQSRNNGHAPFLFKKELSFKNVHFSFEEGRDVLRGVSFTIPRGKLVGLIGPSGAGKTTCVDLMLRLLTPREGKIELDGVGVESIVSSEWHRKVAYVSQDLFLVHDTIRNNIRFHDESISDDEIWDAAKAAHIDGFINECPEGLDTVVGERGIKLSAGQRQRLVIARALARKPELLILDEATSALDNESEEHIKEAIRSLKGNITIVAIAHRLSTIMDADLLVALEDGRVVEHGPPDKLLKDKDSYFYKVNSIVQ